MNSGKILRAAFGIVIALSLSANALAYQDGRVQTEGAEVHKLPDRNSPQLGTLRLNSMIKMSSEIVEDPGGEAWYKLRLPGTNELGYVRAGDVLAMHLKEELKDAGIDTINGEDTSESYPWFLLIRALGLVGANSTIGTGADGNLMIAPVLDYGGEGEISICPLLFTHGYWRRLFSLGVAYQYLGSESVVAGSLIFRFFNHKLWEPEVRLRVGEGLSSGTLFGGINFGIQFPFSIETRVYLAGYFELGDLVGFPLGVAPIHVYGSAGIGLHF